MQKSGVLTGDGPYVFHTRPSCSKLLPSQPLTYRLPRSVDEWIVKGSNSLARVKEQIDLVRQELEGSGTP